MANKFKRALLIAALAAVFITAGAIILSNRNPAGSETPAFDIRLNEVMSSNGSTVPDENGDFYDWVELYNPMSTEADISNWGLTDDMLSVAKFVFPKGTVIAPGEYLVVYCSGVNKGDLYAGFKLSAGDELMLLDTSGKPVDSLSVPDIQKGFSLMKTNGEWQITEHPTPGFANTEDGYFAYREQLESLNTVEGLYINEFMASNGSTITDGYGAYSDYIELFNATSEPMDVSGMHLSDELADTMKYELPEGTVIPANGYLLIFCTGMPSPEGSGELHAPFKLSSYKEAVVLSNKNGVVIDQYEYSAQEVDIAMARMPDGTGDFVPSEPSPGFENTENGQNLALSAYGVKPENLYISEAMGANYSYLKFNGEYTDWLELHNKGSEPLSLSGYGLTNNVKNPKKWTFPDITLGPDEYITVYATGQSSHDTSALEAPFRLSASGESIFLFSPDDRLLDKLKINRFRADQSVGRSTDGTVTYYETPTPNTDNGSGRTGFAQPPVISLASGAYDEGQSVTITAKPGAKIYYTLDGSLPDSGDRLYGGEVLNISKTTVLRAVAVQDGLYDSDAATASYIINEGHQLAIVSVSTEASAYSHMYENYNEEIEVPMHFDIIDEEGNHEYGDDAIIRVFGAYSRMKEQKGLAIIARAGYGKSRIENKIFDDLEFTEYKSFILRASGQESTISRIRDVVITSLVADKTDLPVQDYRSCVLYVNGEFRGVYHMREKINKHYIAQHYNVEEPDSIDILVGNGNKSGYVLSGTNEDYMALLDFVTSHDMSDPENYAYVCSQVDVENFAEYTAMEIYVGNTDTGNIKYFKTDGGKWKWIVYDFCWAMNSSVGGEKGYKWNAIAKYLSEKGHGVGSGFSNKLIKGLLENEEFEELFLNACAKMANEVFEESAVIARVDEIEASISHDMERDVLLWPNMSHAGWKKSVNRIREFAQNRKPWFVYQLKERLGLSTAQCMELFGIEGNNPA